MGRPTYLMRLPPQGKSASNKEPMASGVMTISYKRRRMVTPIINIEGK